MHELSSALGTLIDVLDCCLNMCDATFSATGSHGAVTSVLSLTEEHGLIPNIVQCRVTFPSMTKICRFFGRLFDSPTQQRY